MPVFFDTHAHYFDKKFDTLPSGAEGLLESPDFQSVVLGIINAGTNLDNCRKAIDMAKKYPFAYAAVGIHPEDAQGLPDGAPMNPETTLSAVWDMVKDPQRRREDKIIAIGEIGLDYYWEPMDKPLQKTFFEGQLEIARRTGLPVLIHDREAHGDCFETVLKYPDVKGVFHGYSGSAEMARELTRRGWYIAFGGTITFKNAHRVREVAASVPTEKLLLETDCPYMAPVPHRGKICHSAMIPYMAEVLADLHGTTLEEISRVTCENVKKLFDLN
ncbi:MAG: TatD family deoxyribonuclease [Ruminococcaceae bacterium]|nr:TatD family deoxyribonuclease [Oscillospiraceae bacterium]